MRKYETVFISDPDLSEQAREELFERVRNIIERENGIILNFDEWGLKKLSYEIKKKLRGYYTCLTYGGTGELVTELERNFRLSDLIMKFMTVLVTEHVTEESLRQEAQEAAETATKDEQETAAKEQEQEAQKAEEAGEEAPEKEAEVAEQEAEVAESKADDQDEPQETESEETAEPVEEAKE